jgi:hypothetical protein
VSFLQWFVHPDGTFGGIYGSRRTSVVYLGGLARLAPALPVAGAMFETLAATMSRSDSVAPSSVDMGNLAPLLTSTVSGLELAQGGLGAAATLPMATAAARVDFPEAGLFVRSTPEHYAVIGATNGGTVTVFSRRAARLLIDDGGYVAEYPDGRRITTQSTDRGRRVTLDGASIQLEAPFVRMAGALPTPVRFGLLRLLNLTVMRSIAIGNWVKRRLVRLLMSNRGGVPIRLTRRIVIEGEVRIEDRIENPTGIVLNWMTGGRPFSSIHMASAGYSQGGRLGTERPASIVDVQRLARERVVEIVTRL